MKLNRLCRLVAVVGGLLILVTLINPARLTPSFVSAPSGAFWLPYQSPMNSPLMTLVLIVVGGWIITTWVRAKYGYPLDDGAGNPVHKEKPREEALEVLRAALAVRDERIAALEDRGRVLERIATDRKSLLEEEFERLRV